MRLRRLVQPDPENPHRGLPTTAPDFSPQRKGAKKLFGVRRAPRFGVAAPARGEGFAFPWDAIEKEPLADRMASSSSAAFLPTTYAWVYHGCCPSPGAVFRSSPTWIGDPGLSPRKLVLDLIGDGEPKINPGFPPSRE